MENNISWKTIFLKNSGGFSSKRILAVLGFCICCAVFVAGFITGKEIPEFGDVLLICSISLYGTEIVPKFWNKNINKT